MNKEIWKPINGFEGRYEVSDKGRVKSLAKEVKGKGGCLRSCKEKILSISVGPTGYEKISLRKNNKTHYRRIHRLVASAFIPNPDEKRTVNHIDGNKLNNNLSNLEWATYSENHLHAYKNGLHDNVGENHRLSKFSKNQVLQIRSIYKQGWFTQKEIADAYKVTSGIISLMVNRKTYKYI